MNKIFEAGTLKFFRVALFLWLAAIISASSAQALTVSYTLNDVFLKDDLQIDGSPMEITGAFDWTYAVGDFEGGSGVFTALEIPYTTDPLNQDGMILTIEHKQIEISLDGNFHDYGLDISLKFVQPLSLTQSSLINLDTSFFECCGNGFHDQPFKNGSISPVMSSVPIPAAFLLFAGGMSLLIPFGWRRK